ncbi:HTH-type transcriptional regulator BetI [Streptomyces sp. RB5]|uniref:HTH-type transcriptional regulator BetI n=1 Tax=Streptomyces smaragdinus TaxID=2585196 RepID=A0A7K0CQW7_9ACTN|nr:TetR/AcrR family transcriptional regulator [Streptomyces smaragdinus]MQY15877.1 HTH-type transcriptional regulator BetI [Streptomyces smaragdinus]
MAGTNRTRLRGEKSREEILDAALRLMGERGYDGTSVAAVSAAVGVPKSLVFHHFGSKLGLLSAVMIRGAYRFFDAMKSARADVPEGGTHVKRLTWLLSRTAEAFDTHHDFHRLHTILMMTSDAAEPEVQQAIDQVRTEGRVQMHRLVSLAFADLGPGVARAVADELDDFGMLGFDGGFIAERGDGTPLVSQMGRFARAMAAIGEGRAAELAADEATPTDRRA